MNSEEVKRLVSRSEETAAVEFKRARGGVPADFWPSYSAFANTDGGTIDKYPKRLEVSNPGTLRMSKSVAIAGGTSDARNGKIFNIFSLVRIGERSGMGLSSLYGVWKRVKFTEQSIDESYELDRTKVTVEYEPDESEVGVIPLEVGEETQKVMGDVSEVIGSNGEVKGKADISDDVNRDFEVLTGAYRSDFRDKARWVLSVLAEGLGIDIEHVAQKLGPAEISVLRAVRALKDEGLLVREGATRGSKWIVNKVEVLR